MHRLVRVVAVPAAASLCAIGVAACGSGGSTHSTPASTAAAAYTKALDVADGRPPRTPTDTPVPASSFARPIAMYRRYALADVSVLQRDVAALRSALARGDRPGAEAAWRAAFDRYLRLGAVYGEFGDLDFAIDGTDGGLQGGPHNPKFVGLHRIEYGLWGTGDDPTVLVPVADQLAANVAKLHHVIPTVSLPVLDYTLRAHEILEDAQRDFLSGTDVRWSGEGVLATASGLAATDEVVSTVSGLLDGDQLVSIQTQDRNLHAVFDRLRRDHGGTLPTNGQLTIDEREQLDGAVGGLLEELQEIPPELETTPPPRIPDLPSR